MTETTDTPAPEFSASTVANDLVDVWRSTGSTAALLDRLWTALDAVPPDRISGHLAAVALAAVMGQGEAIALAERLVAGGPR